MAIFFSSDHHFWHRNVISYCNRPHSSVEEMNEALITAWNATVAPDDIVYYLGDFSLAFRPVELYTNRLNGIKHLIMGNHDFAHPAHKKSRTKENQDKWTQKYLDNGWASVQQEMLLDIPILGKVRLNHMPYGGNADGHGDKHQKHRPIDDGMTLLHGHCHEKFSTKLTDNYTLMVNVGVDSPNTPWNKNYRPASLDEIIEIIKKEKI